MMQLMEQAKKCSSFWRNHSTLISTASRETSISDPRSACSEASKLSLPTFACTQVIINLPNKFLCKYMPF